MNQKGFSLIEVLFALILVTTIGLTLLKDQQISRQLLNQFILEAGASQYLDAVEEYLLLQNYSFPKPPQPYLLKLAPQHQSLVLSLDYFSKTKPIERRMST